MANSKWLEPYAIGDMLLAELEESHSTAHCGGLLTP